MMSSYSIDDVDFRILQLLIYDSTISHRDIGLQVHMTGQAVGARIRKMQDTGVIEGYTVRWNPDKIGETIHAFITVFLGSNTIHPAFQTFAKQHDSVKEMHRVSGEGCYWIRVRAGSQEDLNIFLDELLKFGNYRVNLSMGKLK